MRCDVVGGAGGCVQANVHYCIIGLQILHMLVVEMNTNQPGRTLSQHRKVIIV